MTPMTMRLKNIRLKSFGCFDRRDFDLSEGVNLIFGPNFSGKSTLVNSIFFALTGKPIIPKVALTALTQTGGDSGTAGIGFCDDEQEYQLFRSTLGHVQLRRQEEDGWHVLLSGKRTADEELRGMFHLTYHHLAAATFLREGEIFEFLVRQPSDRREILYALLGIDRLIDARQRFIEGRRIAKREEKRIQEHQRSLRVSTVKSHQEEIQRNQDELGNLEKEYELLSSRTTGAQDEMLVGELTQTRLRLENQAVRFAEERASSLSGFSDVAHIRQTIETVETAIAETQALESQREKLIQEIGSLNSQCETLTATCENLRQLIESDRGHCPTCQQRVQESVVVQIVKEKETEKIKCKKGLEVKQQQLDEHTANLTALRELNERRQLLRNRIEALERIDRQLGEVRTECDVVDKKLQALQSESNSGNNFSTEMNVSEAAQLLEHRRQLGQKIGGLRKRLVALNKEEAVMAHKLEQLQHVRSEAGRILQTRLSLELACDGVEKTIQALQQQILQPAEEELQRWLKRMDLFAGAKVDLKSQHLLPSLQLAGNDRSLMLLSGSEKMILYLCLKVSLSRALGNPGFFVFDDPTLHLDAERRNLMIEFICQLADEHQVIVTSNDPEIRDRFEGAHVIETRAVD